MRLQRAAFEARKTEQVGDDAAQPVGFRGDSLRIIFGLTGVAKAIGDHIAINAQASQRCAEFMRGTRSELHLLENLGAQRVTLTAADMQEIATSMSKFVVYGDRMGEAHMSQIDYTI